VITANVGGQRLSGFSVDELIGRGIHVHARDSGMPDMVGAPAGGFRMTTKPEETVGGNPRHYVVGVVDAPAAVVAQREGQRLDQLIGRVAARRAGGLSKPATLTDRIRIYQE